MKAIEVDGTTVTLIERPHWAKGTGLNPNGAQWRAYDVAIAGTLYGQVWQSRESTDRHYNRIRVPGKGRLAWSWSRIRKDGGTESSAPGLYERTLRAAVARVIEPSRR